MAEKNGTRELSNFRYKSSLGHALSENKEKRGGFQAGSFHTIMRI